MEVYILDTGFILKYPDIFDTHFDEKIYVLNSVIMEARSRVGGHYGDEFVDKVVNSGKNNIEFIDSQVNAEIDHLVEEAIANYGIKFPLSEVDLDITHLAVKLNLNSKENVSVISNDKSLVELLHSLNIRTFSVEEFAERSLSISGVKEGFLNKAKEFIAEKILMPNGKFETPPAIGVDNLAITIAKIIPEFTNDSGMMVGIFGKWGRGKTYLFRRILKTLQEDKTINYIPVEFSSWKYTSTNSSWAYLYKSLYESYLADNSGISKFSIFKINFVKIFILNIKKNGIWPIMLLLASVTFFGYISFADKIELVKLIQSIIGVVVFVKIILLYIKHKNSIVSIFTKYFEGSDVNDILGVQDKLQEELKILLEVWIPKGSNKKIVLFIDDLDRCSIDQVIDTLDGLRLILDDRKIHERIVIVTAVDDRIVRESFNIKYTSFHIENDGLSGSMYTEYLEKIFILGVKLPALDDEEKVEIFETLKKHCLELEGKQVPSLVNPAHALNTEVLDDSNNDQKQLKVMKSSEFKFSKDVINSIESDALKSEVLKLSDATPRRIKILLYKYILAVRLYSSITGESVENNTSKTIIKAISHKGKDTADPVIRKISDMLSVF